MEFGFGGCCSRDSQKKRDEENENDVDNHNIDDPDNVGGDIRRRRLRKKKMTMKRRIVEYFKLRNDKNETFADEILGGVTMFLVSLYMLHLSQTTQGMLLL